MFGRGNLQRLPAPLRPFVQRPLDAIRRTLVRLRWLFGVSLNPRRLAATRRFLRHAGEIQRQPARDPDRLRVAVDAEALWDTMTGIGWYLHTILAELADRSDLELRLYGPPSQGKDLPNPITLPEGPAIHVVRCLVPTDQSLPLGLAHAWLGRLQPRMIAAADCDVVWLPNFLEPRRFSKISAPRVVTVHDLAALVVPETLRESRLLELTRDLPAELERASMIITPSETVRREILEQDLATGDEVEAILHGPGHLGSAGEATIASELGPPELGLPPQGYVLHVGTLEPRKNIAFLLEVWERWHTLAPRECLPLVLCGGSGWKTEAIEQRIANGLARGWLVRPGYVDDRALQSLYAGARFSVSASLYEGFGLPIVESMAVGTPVLCSDIPVYREVGADAVRYAATDDPGAWLEAVRQLATDRESRDGLRQRGLQRTAQFSWSRAASRIAEILGEVARQAGP